MECRTCGTSLEGRESRAVAHWHFCVPCFDAMLREREEAARASEAPPPAAAPPAAVPPEPLAVVSRNEVAAAIRAASRAALEPEPAATRAATPGAARCQLCDELFAPAELVDLGFWKLCQGCYPKLVSRPTAQPVASSATPAGSDEEDGGATPAGPQLTACEECGRRVPWRGMKELEGHRYCPDCARKLSPPEVSAREVLAQYMASQAASTAADAEQPPRASATSAGHALIACEACERPIPEPQVQYVEAHRLCDACVEADLALALELARARHRRSLAAARSKLLG